MQLKASAVVVMLLKSFWVVAWCQFLVYNQRFGNTRLSHLQGLR
jgi:hypothetical protein